MKNINKKFLKAFIFAFLISFINFHIKVTLASKVVGKNISQDKLHLNIDNTYIGKGKVSIKAGSSTGVTKLIVNGQDVTSSSKPDLGDDPVLTFQVIGTDTFFKNAIVINKDILKVFDDKISSWKTLKVPVKTEYIKKGSIFTVSMHSGTKGSTFDHNSGENNDDFEVKNIKLILPDGRIVRTTNYINASKIIKMGDNRGEIEILNCTFKIPDDAFKALNYEWDTTKLKDGTNYLVTAKNNSKIVTAKVKIDNTPPSINTNIKDIQYKGKFNIKADAVDVIAGLKSINAVLDGKKINLPYSTSSVKLSSGKHILELKAEDKVSNIGAKTINFTTPVENPNIPEVLTNMDNLKVKVSDPTNDDMTVKFKKGYKYTVAEKGITTKTGASEYHPIDGNALSESSISLLRDDDNRQLVNSSIYQYPYHLFEVKVQKEAKEDDTAELLWKGSSNAGSKLAMYVWNYEKDCWEIVSSNVVKSDIEFLLKADIKIKDRVKNSIIKVLIQEYFSSRNSISTNKKSIEYNTLSPTLNKQDTPRDNYDFTFVWETDTQYYDSPWCQYLLNMHNWIIENKDRMKIAYLFHTGDVVDIANTQQFKNANNAFNILDKAGMPYGVLAGNHDVDHKKEDYAKFSKYFSEKRYVNNPWYGGDYKNNKGHYDLISKGGLDFIMIYMGWGIGDKEIAWINNVLKQYPDRKAILCFHEYLEVTGGLGEIPKKIHDKIVKPNPNVCMVLSGHYHGSNRVVEQFDDNDDGISDRNVNEILFDYQDIPDGGGGYMRLMHFDIKRKKIIFRTYSPVLGDYDADVSEFSIGQQEYEIPFNDLNLVPKEKKVATDYMQVSLYTNDEIGEVKNVKSGSEVTMKLNNYSKDDFGWYAEASDAFGGKSRSTIVSVK